MFLVVTDFYDDSKVLINLDEVAFIAKSKYGGSLIWFKGVAQKIHTKEKVKTLNNYIKKQNNT